jgi:hypothetical protein
MRPAAACLPAALLMLGAASLSLPLPAAAQSVGPPLIYTCTDANGKKLTSDRPIIECNSREQRVLNSDGSVKQVRPPTLTSDERSEVEARERDAAAEQARRLEAIRRDRNLLARFPNEAAHRKARVAALDDVNKAVRASEARLAALAAERKPLTDEAEFYVGKPLPAKIRTQLDANDAAVDAQRSLVQNQRLEVIRIDALYDAELERLKKLWSGAQPGSMGVIASKAASASPAK